MKKWLVSLLLIGSLFAYDFDSGIDTTISFVSNNMFVRRGYRSVTLYALSTSVVTEDLVWYGKNIGGFSSMAIYGMDRSAGAGITTISAQACYPDLSLVSGSAQTLTVGTVTTDIRSAYYKFSFPNASSRLVSFNFILR